MRLASSPGRWSDGGFPRGTSSRRVWLAAAGVGLVAVLVTAVVTCGADEPSSVEPPAADLAEMFGEANADSTWIGPSSSASTETGAEDIGIGFSDIFGGIWDGLSILVDLIATLIWALIWGIVRAIWGIVRAISPLLTFVAFGWTVIAIMRRSWYYERLNALPRAVGFGALASIVPLCIWIFA